MSIEYSFKISIVMAVYNVEQYIEESLQSIIKQDIGFENIQLILVNDGSYDSSGDICKKYSEKYKNNIIYVEKENGGVSSARNLGLNYVKGKYVNFLDADDLLSKNTCKVVYRFFEENINNIDVVSIPMFFFEGKKGEHILNYKFNKTHIVDINSNYNEIQLSSSSAFVKSLVLSERKFDEKLKYGEDAKLITQVILEKMKYGVVSEAKYFYRVRSSQVKSAIQSSKRKIEWYTDTVNNFHLSLLNYARNKYGSIPQYVQFLIMYDMQWRLNTKDAILNGLELEKYIDVLKTILKNIDDNIIYEQNSIGIDAKNYALFMKHSSISSDNLTKKYGKNGFGIYYNECLVDSLYNKSIQINILKVKRKNILELHAGFSTILESQECNIYIMLNDKYYIPKKIVRNVSEYYESPLKHKIIECVWEIELETSLINEIRFYFEYNEKIYTLNPTFTKYGKIVTRLSKSYYNEGNFIFTKTGKVLVAFKTKLKNIIGREVFYILELLKKKYYKEVLARGAYFLSKLIFRNKKIWLFMDRIDKAQDNGEALFKYINNNHKEVKSYFVISKSSDDYERMKKYGKVIPFGTYKTKMYYLNADKVISSQIDEPVINPFGGQEEFYRGLMNYDKVFLQHGITKDDLTGWLNKYNKDINLFVTAAKDEYKSILEYDYYYDTNVVKLTGFPRFDYLEKKNSNKILIMPTWRKSLAGINDSLYGRSYNEYFRNTDYFRAWNAIINNKKIINAANENNYEILFVPHPNMIQQLNDFDRNDYVKFYDNSMSYNQLFCECSLLITDYSSVAFDCAYLKNPIIYYQFDKESFFNEHTYEKGYFNYEEMGFGKVCYTEEMFVDEFVKILENNCNIEEKYVNRINQFYKYTDKNNCKRVYDELLEMGR